MDVSKRRSLTGGGGEPRGDGIIAVVKDIDKSNKGSEKKVKIKEDGARGQDAIFVPKKYAKDLKPEHKYEFHLEADTFRGGGGNSFSGAAMIRRTNVAPTEIRNGGLSGGGSSGNGFRSR